MDITCDHFFDGTEMHGATRLTFGDAALLAIEPYRGSSDYFLVSPGLVDIQMNGFEEWDISHASHSDLVALDQRLASVGTTSWLATVVTAPLDTLSSTINSLHHSIASGMIHGCRGIHLEGPFLGNANGAHRADWIIPIDIDWLRQLPESVRLVTIGAEQAHATEAIRLLTAAGIRTSVGHTIATDAQLHECMKAGAHMVTHLYNGMSGVHHRDGGVALWALTTDGLNVGMIGDGVHCSPAALSLAFRSKADEEVVLVSDSIGWNSPAAIKRGISISNGAPRLPDGTLAGSSATLAQCVARSVFDAKIPLTSAVRAATANAARVAGLPTAGMLSVGSPPDFVAFDPQLSVVNSWRRLQSERA